MIRFFLFSVSLSLSLLAYMGNKQKEKRKLSKKRFWLKAFMGFFSLFLVLVGILAVLIIVSLFPASMETIEFKAGFLEILLATFSLATSIALARVITRQVFVSSTLFAELKQKTNEILQRLKEASFRMEELPRDEREAIAFLSDQSFEGDKGHFDVVSCLFSLSTTLVTTMMVLISDPMLLDSIHLRSVLVFSFSLICVTGIVTFVVAENLSEKDVRRLKKSIAIANKTLNRHRRRGR